MVPFEHVANFYDRDADLVRALAGHVADGIATGEQVIVLATPAHRRAVERTLVRQGVDSAGARERSFYVTLDAADTLAEFMVDGVPDPARFIATIGRLMDRAFVGLPVRVFGEMVALLWQVGNVPAAIEVESLWNEFSQVRKFSLLCGYSMSVLAERTDLRSISDVCGMHSDLVQPLSYTEMPGRVTTAGLDEQSALFLPLPTALAAVRRFVTNALTWWGEDGLVVDATIVATELATNALRHAASPFRTSISRSGSVVRISVEDIGGAHPRLLDADPERLGGRGVAMVAALSQCWGHEALLDGKVVWSELPVAR